MPNQIVRLRSKILLPLGLGFCILLVLGFSATYFLQKQALDNNITHRITNARVLFKELLKIEAELLGSLAGNYSEIEELQNAFMAGDREQLLAGALPLFNTIKTRNKITHFYFHTLDKTCFLRVYNPDRHGDRISRYTLDQCARLEAPTYGIELGTSGTLTFRLVHPWRVNGKLVGFIELGKEIDQITPIFKHMLNLELVFAVQKRHLDHKLWAEGKTLAHKPDNWNQFNEFVVVSSTFRRMSSELGRELASHFTSQSKELFTAPQENRVYRGGAIPLIDAAGLEVGDIFVFANYSNVASSRNLFIILILLSVLALATFYTIFSFHISRIERDLQSSMTSLEMESARHQDTASQLAQHRDLLEVLNRQQEVDLAKSRAKVKELSGILPSCACCKKVRNTNGEWEPLELYIQRHSEAELRHSYCPECASKFPPESQ